jgi:hypothetical protein
MAVDLDAIFEKAEDVDFDHVLLIGISSSNGSFHIIGDEDMTAPISLTLLAVAQKLAVDSLSESGVGPLN